MKAVFNLNYDLVDLMKLYRKKQIAYQSIVLLLDICFYHDLTVLLSLEGDKPTNKPTNNLQLLKKQLKFKLSSFIKYIRGKNQMNTFVSKQQSLIHEKIIIQIMNSIEILQTFLKDEARSLNSFDYLALPKFSLDLYLNGDGHQDGHSLERTINAEKIEKTKRDASTFIQQSME